MRPTRRTVVPVPARAAFAGYRFRPEVIVLVVRWYPRFGAVLSGCRGAAGRARRRGGLGHGAPVGAAVRAGVGQCGPVRPTPGRRPLAHRRDLPEGRWALGAICIARSASSGRSSTSTRRPAGTARRRAGSFSGRGPPAALCRWRSSDWAPRVSRVLDELWLVAWHQRRAVRKQPGRSGPRAVEASAAASGSNDQPADTLPQGLNATDPAEPPARGTASTSGGAFPATPPPCRPNSMPATLTGAPSLADWFAVNQSCGSRRVGLGRVAGDRPHSPCRPPDERAAAW
jgi:hypothetical protein